MAAGDDNNNDIDAVDYEHFSLYHLYVGNHFDQHYQEYLKNQQESSATVAAHDQDAQTHSDEPQPSPETTKDHPTPREFEKICHDTADPACERLAAETRQNVKLIEPRTAHTYCYKDAKTGEMVEKGIKPDMVIAFSHDGVRGKNVVVDAKSHKGALQMSDYTKLERDRKVTKSSYAILFVNTNSKVPNSVLEAVEKNDRMEIIRYNGQQPDVTSREFVDKVGPHVSGSTFRADDQRYEQHKTYVQKSDLQKQKFPNPLGNQNSELTKNTHRHLISYDFQHPRKQDGSLDRDNPVNEGLKEDGTPDMRLEENKTAEQVEQHLTEEGEPDKRFNDNKSEKQLEAHTTKDGEPDHRYKENQELQHEHLKDDGTPDMRFKENQEAAATSNSEQADAPATRDQAEHVKDDGTPDMRFKENQEAAAAAATTSNSEQSPVDVPTTSDQAEHVKDDGTPDMRFKENQEAAAAAAATSNSEQVDVPATSDQAEHVKDDGTPDMRFKENQEAAAAAATSNSEQSSFDVPTTSDQAEHVKDDGTPDMRFKENQEAAAAAAATSNSEQSSADAPATSDQAEHVKDDGTPDMRFKENQEAAASAEAQTSADEGVSAEVGTFAGEAGEEEHLKGDGTLDMRFNSSKETVAEMGGGDDISGMNEGMDTMDLDDAGETSGGDGPLKADGTPDMRFSDNQ